MPQRLIGPVVEYIKTTPFLKKFQDATSLAILGIVYGLATGTFALEAAIAPWVMIPLFLIIAGVFITSVFFVKPNTIESAFHQSKKVTRVLDALLFNMKFHLAANFLFHNGQTNLNGRIHFMKSTVNEFSVSEDTNWNNLPFRDIPFNTDIEMLQALTEGKMYMKEITNDEPYFREWRNAKIKRLIYFPIHDAAGRLQSYLLIGCRDPLVEVKYEDIQPYAEMIEKATQ